MVLTKPELISSLQHEMNILLHLAGKVDRAKLDYRPTPKQRSTIELLRYLVIMGPELIKAAKAGKFDPAAWTMAEKSSTNLSFDETVAAIAAQRETYPALLADLSDDDFRETINMFGSPTSRGAFIVNLVLCGCAAYRTQLFVYLKACGREELSTMNLWAGADAPAPVS
jgi:DinB family protein